MATGERQGLVTAIRIDLRRLHNTWMALRYPRQREEAHSVLGRWRPQTTLGRVLYNLWAVLGAIAITVLYPLAVVGFATRFYTRRISHTAASLGIVGVVIVSVIAWGGLTVLARYRFTTTGFIAVAAAGSVATVAAVFAVLFWRLDGRVITVVFAYPAAMTAIFLPPVVAALYSPTLAAVVFPSSQSIAVWLLDHVLIVGGIATYLRARFSLEGFAYVGMWFGLAVPIGWFLGIVVTLANVVRPSDADASGDREAADG
ncbi:MAG: hypothetical protein ABEH65_08105 [Halobacteriales archaeon]